MAVQICALERKEHISQVRALCVQAEKIEKRARALSPFSSGLFVFFGPSSCSLLFFRLVGLLALSAFVFSTLLALLASTTGFEFIFCELFSWGLRGPSICASMSIMSEPTANEQLSFESSLWKGCHMFLSRLLPLLTRILSKSLSLA